MGLFTDLGKKYANVAKPIVENTHGVKWVGQDPTNFWTGVRLTKPAALLGVSALALYSVGAGMKAASDYKQSAVMTNATNVGPLPATQFEGTAGGRNNLGATGDIVFGLHNMRRGR